MPEAASPDQSTHSALCVCVLYFVPAAAVADASAAAAAAIDTAAPTVTHLLFIPRLFHRPNHGRTRQA